MNLRILEEIDSHIQAHHEWFGDAPNVIILGRIKLNELKHALRMTHGSILLPDKFLPAPQEYKGMKVVQSWTENLLEVGYMKDDE